MHQRVERQVYSWLKPKPLKTSLKHESSVKYKNVLHLSTSVEMLEDATETKALSLISPAEKFQVSLYRCPQLPYTKITEKHDQQLYLLPHLVPAEKCQ